MNRFILALALGVTQAMAIRIIGIEYLLFGGDYDENGCKPSAGYVWCNETVSCIPMNQVCGQDILYTEIDQNLTLTPVL